MEITQQQALRNNVVYDMFVDSADQNYVVARWCFQQNLALDFLWNATHCLGRVDKRDSQDVLNVIQAGICDGDQLGTRPDV